jgi:hypothetical protein
LSEGRLKTGCRSAVCAHRVVARSSEILIAPGGLADGVLAGALAGATAAASARPATMLSRRGTAAEDRPGTRWRGAVVQRRRARAVREQDVDRRGFAERALRRAAAARAQLAARVAFLRLAAAALTRGWAGAGAAPAPKSVV